MSFLYDLYLLIYLFVHTNIELDGGGGVSQVEMLHRSNLVAIIGNGMGTYSNNKGYFFFIQMTFHNTISQDVTRIRVRI